MKRFATVMLATLLLAGAVVGAAPTSVPVGAQVQTTAVTTSPGVVRGWGSNGNKQIGFTSTTLCTSTDPVVCKTPYSSVSLFGVTQVAAGKFHTLFLRADGTVWAVGNDSQGQLGNPSSSADQQTPVQVLGLPEIVAVAAGPYHSLALDKGGTAWQWGQGAPLGEVTKVTNLPDVVAIAAGGDNTFGAWHSLALRDNGTVFAWGTNGSGQLGNGTNNDAPSPVEVTGLIGATAIAAGRGHSLALLNDGTVKAWGENEYGQLGDGTTTDSNVAVSVTGLSGVTAIAAGGSDSWAPPSPNASFSMAQKNDGTVWTWGANYAGQLGNNTTSNGATSSPVQAQGITTATGIAAGGAHALAVLSDHSVSAWGANAAGQLGDGTTTPHSTPVAVALTGGINTQVAAGGNHSFAISALGSLGEYTSMTPARFLDTRPDGATADGQYKATGVINPGGSQDVQITGRNGVPATGVSAVVLNATVTEPTQPSFLTVWPTGFPRPTASNLNYVPGETVPNLVTVGLGVGGKVSLYNNNGSTHAVFDVVGYYSSISGPDGSRVHMITPARIMDTRGFPTVDGQFQGGNSVGPGQTRDLDVTGRAGVPGSNVDAVVINVTVTEPTVFGFVTAYPGDVSRPNASTLNFVPGETVPNLAIVRVPANGIVKFYNLFGNTHLVVDVVGYFDDDESTDAGRVIPLFPGRLFDTRFVGPLAPNATLSLNMSTFNAGITNSQASGYVLNTTVTEPSAVGYLTVFAGDVVRPLASNLNFVAGQTVPNLVMTKVGCPTFPRINFSNSPFGFTHVLADAFGVITNSLLKDNTVCAPPAVPADVGAAETREVDAPALGATLQLGFD